MGRGGLELQPEAGIAQHGEEVRQELSLPPKGVVFDMEPRDGGQPVSAVERHLAGAR